MPGRGLFSRLFGMRRDAPRPELDRYAIPTVEAPPDYPVSLETPRKPRKRAADPEVYERELTAYLFAQRRRAAALAGYRRERAQYLGAEDYIWAAPPKNGCDIAARNGGKRFSWASPPPEGHPGEGECHAADWCRCVAKPIVAGVGEKAR